MMRSLAGSHDYFGRVNDNGPISARACARMLVRNETQTDGAVSAAEREVRKIKIRRVGGEHALTHTSVGDITGKTQAHTCTVIYAFGDNSQ